MMSLSAAGLLDVAVGIGLSRSGPIDKADPLGVAFDDDGYYWHLYPYFDELAKQTGQMVDPYGDAVFKVTHLPDLLAILKRAAASVRKRPKEWKVNVGWRGQDEVYEKVTKATMQRMLRDFIALVKRAIETKRKIVCFGD